MHMRKKVPFTKFAIVPNKFEVEKKVYGMKQKTKKTFRIDFDSKHIRLEKFV